MIDNTGLKAENESIFPKLTGNSYKKFELRIQ